MEQKRRDVLGVHTVCSDILIIWQDSCSYLLNAHKCFIIGWLAIVPGFRTDEVVQCCWILDSWFWFLFFFFLVISHWLKICLASPERQRRKWCHSRYDVELTAMTLFLCCPVQISGVSQDFLMLQQKLNQIIMAHQINPASNGMFTRGQIGADQQLTGKASRCHHRYNTSPDLILIKLITQSLP